MATDNYQFDDGHIRFVLLFEARSGSTYLTEALDSHPQVRAAQEPLGKLKRRISKGVKPPEAELGWLERFFEQPPSDECRAFGFKTKLRDVSVPDGFAQILRNANTRIIRLNRQNRIKKVISLMNSMRLHDVTGQWNLYDTSHRLPPFRVELNEFCELLEQVEEGNRRLVEFVANLNLPTLELYYEDVLLDTELTLQRICKFLDVPYVPLSGHCIKNTSDDLRDVLSNYDELRAHFVGSPYEEMFDEVFQL